MKKSKIVAILSSAALITGLFHKQAFGLNLLIFEIAFLSWLLFTGQFPFKGKNQITISLGFIVTSLFTVITHSVFVYIVNFIAFFAFIGILIYPEVKSVFNALWLSIVNIFASQIAFFRRAVRHPTKGPKHKKLYLEV